jgi:DNA-binding transcriptional ArsR family regulator
MDSTLTLPVPAGKPPLYALPRHRIEDEERHGYDVGAPPRSERPADVWVKVPVAVLTAKALSPWARLCWAMLADHDGRRGCFPSRETLAAELGASVPTIDRALRELVDAGLVVRTRQGRGHTNRYELSRVIGQTADESSPVIGQKPDDLSPVIGPESSPVIGHVGGHLLSEQEPKNKKGGHPPNPPVRANGRPAYTPAVEAFWREYPRGRGTKVEAFTEWQRLALSAEGVGELMAGLARWNACAKWREEGGRYVVHANRFLKYRRWEVEPPPDAPSPNGRAAGSKLSRRIAAILEG